MYRFALFWVRVRGSTQLQIAAVQPCALLVCVQLRLLARIFHSLILALLALPEKNR